VCVDVYVVVGIILSWCWR